LLVVILDLDEEEPQPAFDGIGFLVALRQNYPDIILMLLTNNSEPQYRTKCILLGAHYFFNKTNDFGKIPATLRRIMQSN
jgi:two-component system, NarL family, response regulator DevR